MAKKSPNRNSQKKKCMRVQDIEMGYRVKLSKKKTLKLYGLKWAIGSFFQMSVSQLLRKLDDVHFKFNFYPAKAIN